MNNAIYLIIGIIVGFLVNIMGKQIIKNESPEVAYSFGMIIGIALTIIMFAVL